MSEYDEEGNCTEKYNWSNGDFYNNWTWHKDNNGNYTSEGEYNGIAEDYITGRKYSKVYNYVQTHHPETQTRTAVVTMDNLIWTLELDSNDKVLSREQNSFKSEFKYDENGTITSIDVIDSENNAEPVSINSNTLLKNVNDSSNQKAKIAAALQNVPPEALRDLAIECSEIRISSNLGRNIAGQYNLNIDMITLTADHDITAETIVHELGHAIAHFGSPDVHETSVDSKFYKNFTKERKKYSNKGGNYANHYWWGENFVLITVHIVPQARLRCLRNATLQKCLDGHLTQEK